MDINFMLYLINNQCNNVTSTTLSAIPHMTQKEHGFVYV